MAHRTAFTPLSCEGDQRFGRLWKLLVALIAAGVVVISAGPPVWAHSQARGEVGTDDGEQFRHAADQAQGDEPARAQMASTASCNLEEDTVLTEEIRDCWTLRITGDAITVDLNGFTIGGVVIEGNGVTLRNGTVAWSEGTAIYIAGSGAVLEELTVQGSGEVDDSTGFGGFVVEVGHNTTIRKSVFRDLGGIAVDQYYGGGTVVSDSTFMGNYIGVSIQEMGGAIIENNRFEGNMRGVNVWDEEPAGGAVGTIVRRNQLVGNEVGIRVRGEQDASGTLIEPTPFGTPPPPGSW